MPTATRFTTRYDTGEDRIQLLLELPDNNVQVLWLTRRLLNRMLPHLLDRLQGTGPAASATSAPAQSSAPSSEAVQRFSQEAAVSAIVRQPAVAPSGKTPAERVSYVVTSVDIRTGPKSLVLDFKGGEQVLHSLPFGEDALRQWLSIIYAQYRTGEWRETFWPGWIQTPDAAPAPKEDMRLN